MNETITLPTSGDIEDWTEDQKALLSLAGLTYKVDAPEGGKRVVWAPRPFVVGFLRHCERTGLDPIAKQIYAINRKGEWSIQVSIDAMRIIAQRSREYEGQTIPEWCGPDGVWREVWLEEEHPAAARIGVWRRGFREPTYGVARFRLYAPDEVAEWAYDPEKGVRARTGKTALPGLWSKGDDFMIEKVAEAKALRKAFPMDLSGLYIPEEMAGHEGAVLTIEESAPARRSRLAQLRAKSEEAVDAEEPSEAVEAAQSDSEAVPVSLDQEAPKAAQIKRGGQPARVSAQASGAKCSECGKNPVQEEGDICASCEDAIMREEGKP